MKVIIARKAYQMTKNEATRLLGIASQQVPYGVYAIEKKDYIELRADKCNSITKLKQLIQSYKRKGFKVHYNGKN